MSRAMNKLYAAAYHPETGKLVVDLTLKLDVENFRMVQPVPVKEGMRFLCSKGHVAFSALTEKKKGKKHCSKIVSYGQCLFPVEQVYYRSLMKLVKRAFHAGVNDAKVEDRILAGLDPPKPFVSDGCSVIGPIAKFLGYENSRIRECCVKHDRTYRKGGPIREKFKADREFLSCLLFETNLPTTLAYFMWFGVAIGGFIPHPCFRWGFGWPFPKYKADV